MIFSIKENKENEIQFRICHYIYVFCIEYMKGTIVSQLIDIIDKGWTDTTSAENLSFPLEF